MVKIATWNINSLRVRIDPLLDWLEKNRPDVVLLQETKVPDQEFPVDELGDAGYDAVFHGQRAYNGVAILAKDELKKVIKGLPGDDKDDHRRLISADIEGIRFVSLYVPNGQAVGSEQFTYKLNWLERLATHLPELTQGNKNVLLAGDFNIAPTDDDVWDPKEASGGTHVTPQERNALQKILDKGGLIDTYRALHPATRQFTWWDYRSNAFPRNAGMRIDLFLLSKPLFDRVEKITVDVAQRAAHDSSDHAPVLLELRD